VQGIVSHYLDALNRRMIDSLKLIRSWLVTIHTFLCCWWCWIERLRDL